MKSGRILLTASASLAILVGFGLSLMDPGFLAGLLHLVEPEPPLALRSIVLLRLLGMALGALGVVLLCLIDFALPESRTKLMTGLLGASGVPWIALALTLWNGNDKRLYFNGSLVLGMYILTAALAMGLTGPWMRTAAERGAPLLEGGGAGWRRQIREAAAQQERNRIARDLHDSIKQQLFAVKVSAATCEARWESDPGGARAALGDVRRSAQAAMAEMQALLVQLRPEALATIGLVEALREQCEALGYRTGARVHFEFDELPPDDRLPASSREALFRIAQETLANVARHARASEVHVRLRQLQEERGSFLTLSITDDGQGFDPAGTSPGMGLRNIRERLELLGGSLEIASAPGEGASLAVRVLLSGAFGDTAAPVAQALRGEVHAAFLVAIIAAISHPTKIVMRYGGAILFAISSLSRVRKAGRKVPTAALLPELRRLGHQQRLFLWMVSFWWNPALWSGAASDWGTWQWLWAGEAVLSFGFVVWEAAGLYRLRKAGMASEQETGAAPLHDPSLVASLLIIFFLSLFLMLVANPQGVARAALVLASLLHLGWWVRTVY